MATQKTKKNECNYNCSFCHFNTCKKTDYNRHLLTDKHKNNDLATFSNIEATNKNELSCQKCKKIYKDRTGLWRHKKQCDLEIESDTDIDVNTEKESNNTEKRDIYNLVKYLMKENGDLKSMMMEQQNKMMEQQNHMMEQQNLVLEIAKNGTNNTTNTNSHNKSFNLQFFLNETCKDAMNIMDFVDSIKLQLSDLENVGKLGYVEGISNIITSNLNALDVTQRPIHCADKKRDTIYIKDEDKWEKEDEQKKKIKKAIKRVVCKNQRLIPQFKEKHPDCLKSSSNFSDQYNKIIVESMGGSGDNDNEKEDKIIKNITKNVIIEK